MAKGRRLPSVMKNRFSTVPSANIRRSSFDRSHGYKTTFDVDYLVPIFVDEVLPGDTFSLRMTHLCRLTTLVQPIMDNLQLSIQFFYCPNRLLWQGDRQTSGWEAFITGGDQPVAWTGDNPAEKLFVPQATAPTGGYAESSIYDYMGLPVGIENFRHSLLPLRAYNLIFNEFFRDQNLQESLPVFTGDSDPKVDPDTGEESTLENAVPYQYKLMKRNKRYDYFTSCLPGLQRGPSVGIGIAGGDSGRLPVQGLAIRQIGSNFSNGATYNPLLEIGQAALNGGSSPTVNTEIGLTTSGQPTPGAYFYLTPDGAPASITGIADGSPTVYFKDQPIQHNISSGGSAWSSPKLDASNWPIYVDLGAASSVTINSLRNAITLQRWFEKNARHGGRYQENILGHFGVHAQDFRLQRPEYLGGSKTFISINPTVQTSSTDSTSPQGNLSAYALSTDSKHLFTKSFVEHGWIIGLASVTADLTYQQGLDRMWSRFSRYDFYWPTFAHLGEQPVYNKEIYCQSDSEKDPSGVSKNDLPFGYQERYAEYRYKPSKITSKFRSTAQGTLDSWHLSQKFLNLPTLNSTFIQSNTPLERALAVPSQPDILADFYFSLKCVRPMPVYSVPGLRRL